MLIEVPRGKKLAFVGDIHECETQFDKLLLELGDFETNGLILVSLGDIYDRGEGPHIAESIIRKIRGLHDRGHAYMVRGNHEQKHIKKNKTLSSELEWCSRLPVCLSFRFHNGMNVVAIHAGVTPKSTIEDLHSTESMYVRTVNSEGGYIPLIYKDGNLEAKEPGVPWGEVYDGRFGYIVAGHDKQDSGKPVYWKHACNIDTACFKTGILSCLVISENGNERLIQVS